VTQGPEKPRERGVGDAVREAVDRTLRATAGSAAVTRDRAGELLDEVTRRSREAREELTRRGQEAGAELARRGQEAGAELSKRLEALERRLGSVEDALRREAREGQPPPSGASGESAGGGDSDASPGTTSKSRPEG
jgi:hypothetical protein